MTNNYYPNMLSFARSFELSEALMYGKTVEGKLIPIEVVLTGLRGQSSQAKLNNEKPGASKAGKSNPQMVEIAYLPINCESLVIRAALRVIPNATQPWSTDNAESYDAFVELARAYADNGGFLALAARYVENIANGRFAWRNRSLSEKGSVEVGFDGTLISFNPFALMPGEIRGLAAVKAAVTSGNPEAVDALVTHIATGLSVTPKNLDFQWIGEIPQQLAGDRPSRQVYPSQDYRFQDEPKGAPKRRLASHRSMWKGEEIRYASMNSWKLGAAIRAIDTWHGSIHYGAITVETYGGMQGRAKVMRHANKQAPSYYDIAKKPDFYFEDDLAKGLITDHLHYFMALLVRGGVFGGGAEQ